MFHLGNAFCFATNIVQLKVRKF